jgi:hypothetical protein
MLLHRLITRANTERGMFESQLATALVDLENRPSPNITIRPRGNI